MLLFLGMTISSSTGINLEKQSTKPLSFGSILYVGGNGSGNYTKIQDAIDNTSDGDTVFVYNGTYFENLIVNQSINLIGENKETTVIDGKNIDNVIKINIEYTWVEDFSIRNSGNGSYLTSAGINIFSNKKGKDAI